jgi:putative endonuclease
MPHSESSLQPVSTLDLGRRGEELAAAYLQQIGYRLVAANFSLPVGRNRNQTVINAEIDLVAYEDDVLCFIEVKTRASDWFAAPSVNVDLRKQRQITRGARAYRRMFGLMEAIYRYDVVSIVLSSGTVKESDVVIELLRNFWRDEKFQKHRWREKYWE